MKFDPKEAKWMAGVIDDAEERSGEYPEGVAAMLRAAIEQIKDYENGILWGTSCTNCAKLLDKNYEQYVKLEKLENEIKKWREGFRPAVSYQEALDRVKELEEQREQVYRDGESSGHADWHLALETDTSPSEVAARLVAAEKVVEVAGEVILDSYHKFEASRPNHRPSGCWKCKLIEALKDYDQEKGEK